MADIKRIENMTFGPSETVILDGHVFINCVFDGCEIIFGADKATTYKNCTTARPPRVVLCGAANRTFHMLKFFGFTITPPFGEEPQEQTIQ